MKAKTVGKPWAAASLFLSALLSLGIAACIAPVRYSTEPVDWDQKKLAIRLNVLPLERKDESDDPKSMECLNNSMLRLDLPNATSFLIQELKASAGYREVVLSSGEEWVRSGEVLIYGEISHLGPVFEDHYLGVIHWKVTIPSTRRVLWEGNTQAETDREGILIYHRSKACSALLKQNFWQLREQLAMVLPGELQYQDRRPRARPPTPE
jgi:hypothetical protein